jgi:hypothetical protein
MAIAASSGNAGDEMAPAQDRPVSCGRVAAAGSVITHPGLRRRYPPRQLWALARAPAGLLAASAVLLAEQLGHACSAARVSVSAR